MDSKGDFAVAWSSFGQDGSGYGVYARRYNAAGTALDANEFRVNPTTPNWQYQPDISMDANGNFVVTWSAFGQDNTTSLNLNDYGIFARMFNANGSDYVNPSIGAPLGEFRINVTTTGDQLAAAVAMDADGDYAVAWTSYDADTLGIFCRVVAVNPSTYVPSTGSSDSGWITSSQAAVIPQTQSLVGTPINGTVGNDVFEFTAADSPANWIVKVNGVKQTINAQTTALIFDGLGGNDSITINGSTANITADIYPDQVSVQFGAFTINGVNMETITVNGKGANDTATIHDSSANDMYQAGLGFAKLTSTGRSISANGFEAVTAISTAGTDVAYLFSGGNKTASVYTASPTEVHYSGTGFDNRVQGFKVVETYATPGNSDTATFTDSSGDDKFIGSSAGAGLSGAGFNNSAWNFRHTTVSSSGGSDMANLYGSSRGTDTLAATATAVNFYGAAFDNKVQNFGNVQSYADPAGNNTATLTGSSGDDKLIATATGAGLSGTGFSYGVWNFQHMIVSGNGGSDTANLYGAATGSNTLSALPLSVTLSGTGYDRQVKAFQTVIAHGAANDTAYFYDSAANPMSSFASTPTQVTVSGSGYQTQAQGFGNVQAYAMLGSTGTATFEDSSGDDIYFGSSLGAGLHGAGYNNSAWNFASAQATATSGNDKAYLYAAAAGAGTYVARSTDAVFSGTGYSNHVFGFKTVEAYATPGTGSTATFYDTAGDDRFIGTSAGAAMSGSGFNNSGWNFGTRASRIPAADTIRGSCTAPRATINSKPTARTLPCLATPSTTG